MNPNDYDPNELRGGTSGGGGRDGENRGDSGRTDGGNQGGGTEPQEDLFLGSTGPDVGGGPLSRADEVLQSNQYRELFLLEQTTGEGGLEKPYLSTLPQSYAAEMVVFEWLEFLVKKAGFRGTMDALRYYRSIEWITDGAESRLREYLTSFDEAGGSADLDRSDHLLSLVYLARLAAMD